MKDKISGSHSIKNEKTGQYLAHDGDKVTLSSSPVSWYVVEGTEHTYRIHTKKGDDAPALLLKTVGHQANELELGTPSGSGMQTDKSLWCVEHKNDTTGRIYSYSVFSGGHNEISVQDGRLRVTHEDGPGRGGRPPPNKINPIFMWVFGSPSKK